MEWEAFQQVKNEGGTAPCQRDKETFVIMRKSQFSVWSEQALESYLHDLIDAKEAGINLLANKYAWMMVYSSPEKYEELRGRLPVVTEEMTGLIERIVGIQLEWQRLYARQHPKLAARARPADSSGDTDDGTSVETYLRGELSTYSHRTLSFYMEHIQRLLSQGENMNMLIIAEMVRLYGYPSISAAEQSL
jgi:hypothetical protein